MNEIIQSLHSRKSMRAFTSQPVAPAIKQALLDAALQAPTAGNQIMYSIIDVTDPSLKQALSKSCDNQPFIASAPLVFIFVADHTRWHRGFTLAGANPRALSVGDLMLAVTDTAIAAQNMVMAAESVGLGSCYIGDILEQYETHRTLLDLPDCAVPVCMLVLGYPTEQQKSRKKPERFATQYVVGENKYPHLSDAQILDCFADQYHRELPNGVLTVLQYLERFCNRKFNSEFSREMSRSVQKYLADFATITPDSDAQT